MPRNAEAKPVQVTHTEDVVNKEHDFRSQHDIKWDQLGPADAPYVRQALIRAHELRIAGADPGDAYLEGFVSQLKSPDFDEPTTHIERPNKDTQATIHAIGSAVMPERPSSPAA